MSSATIRESQSDMRKFHAAPFSAAILALICVLLYLVRVVNLDLSQSIPTLQTVATTNNYLANSIALTSLGSLFLVGLFTYNTLSVFESNAMLAVATLGLPV